MFALSDSDLRSRIVGCGDGPASFNAEVTRLGTAMVSCDPIYKWNSTEIHNRIKATYDHMIEQTRNNADEFVWHSIRSVEELGQIRMAAMQAFLNDYDRGKVEGRYVEAALPTLPFGDARFDLALCSHLLFLYTDQLGEAFHQSAILELCRVATQVRIFPLLALGGERSPYVDASMNALSHAGYDVSIDRVPYEFQRGGNEMLSIRRGQRDRECQSRAAKS